MIQLKNIWQPSNEYIHDAPNFTGELEDEFGQTLYLELYHDKLVHVYDTTQSQEIMLENCILQKHQLEIILVLPQGEIKLRGQESIVQQWYEQLKRFCLLENFLDSYHLKLKLKQFDGFIFDCVRLCDNRLCQVQLFKNYELVQQGNTINVLRRLNHPNVQKIYEIYKDEDNIYIVYNKLRGCQIHKYYNEQKLSERKIANCIYQVLSALNHMHDKRLYHNGLNGESILVNDESDNKHTDKISACIINFDQASNKIIFNDTIAVGNILERLARNISLSQSGHDLMNKLKKNIGLKQALFHQWFINKHVAFGPDGQQSLLTIIEKTENEISQFDSVLQRKNDEMYSVDIEEDTLSQKVTRMAHNQLVPSKLRHKILEN